MLRISVLVSGNGSNLQAVLDAIDEGAVAETRVVQVISSNPEAYALERARRHGIPGRVIRLPDYENRETFGGALMQALKEKETDLVLLAGYMKILDREVIEAYKGRIINIHPSLIPKFCGKGFYGRKVHEAVILAGEKESGATVHLVDEGVDTGEILLQERIPVSEEDTPESLAGKVLEVEHRILPEAINMWKKKGEL